MPEEQLLRELEAWEAQLTTRPTIWDAVKQPNINVLGGFILRNFRIAAKDAVRSRERVRLLRDLAIVAVGDMGEAEQFLRAPSLFLHRTPLEAAVESTAGLDQALRALTPHLRSVAMRVLGLLERAWQLSSSETSALIGSSDEELARWRKEPSAIPDAAVERISLLLTIYKALGTLFSGQEPALTWVRRAHDQRPLEGRTALDFMISEGTPGIRLLRDYLEAQIWSE